MLRAWPADQHSGMMECSRPSHARRPRSAPWAIPGCRTIALPQHTDSLAVDPDLTVLVDLDLVLPPGAGAAARLNHPRTGADGHAPGQHGCLPLLDAAGCD